jgi:hypothetical protein
VLSVFDEVDEKDAKVCVRIQGQGRRAKSSTVTTWGATTAQILALRAHLVAANVSPRGDRIHQRLCAT